MATTYNVAASRSAINTALSSCVAGDTIQVAAGTIADWTSTLTINKNISLIGAGVDSTSTRGYGSPASTTTIPYNGIVFTPSGDSTANLLRIAGFYLSSGRINFTGLSNASATLRLDHLYVTNNYTSYWAQPFAIKGILIDHTSWVYTGTSAIRMFIFSGQTGADPAVWREDSAIGTANNVFIEDSILDGGTGVPNGNHMAFQVWWAGRVVLRNSTIRNFAIDVHDYRDSSQRGGRSWEIYDNTWTRTSGIDLEWMNYRGGTGIVYNNVMTETSQVHGIALMSYSSYGYVSPVCCMYPAINGHSYTMDNIGRGKFTGTKRPGDSSLATDCQNPLDWEQELEPAYFWSNTRNGSTVNPGVGNGTTTACGGVQGEQDAIKVNRDYYNRQPQAGDPFRTSYTPYTYPHPLNGSTPGPPIGTPVLSVR